MAEERKNRDELTEDDLTLTGASTLGGDDTGTTDDDELSEEELMTSSENQTFITREGLKKLKDELIDLETVKRKDVAIKLKEAISFGDLSENSEYDDAKNEQALLESQIINLKEKIKTAKIIAEKKAKSNVVKIGSTVQVQNITDHDKPESYMIVGSTETDPIAAKISNESPIGIAVIDHKEGDEVVVNAPVGKLKYKILKIS